MTATAVEGTASISRVPESIVRSGHSIHQVRRGETLSGIVLHHLRAEGQRPSHADLYKKVAEVASANGISDPDLIFPGQEILFNGRPSPPVAMAAADPARACLVETLTSAGSVDQDVGGPRRAAPSFPSLRLESFRQAATDLLAHPIRYAKGAESLMRLLPSPGSRNEAAAVGSLRDGAPAASHVSETEGLPGALSPWAALVGEPARLTSPFGPRKDPFDGSHTHHDGIDLAARRGAKIYPYAEGTVKFSGWKPGYGNVVVVRHADGLETVYGHNAKNLVRAGEKVGRTDALATVGSTGRSTGPHLHFEIRTKGRAVDPVPYMTKYAGGTVPQP
jgi:murein DD-endopeptidase MepM/ murein hydrolase activator NlpD